VGWKNTKKEAALPVTSLNEVLGRIDREAASEGPFRKLYREKKQGTNRWQQETEKEKVLKGESVGRDTQEGVKEKRPSGP